MADKGDDSNVTKAMASVKGDTGDNDDEDGGQSWKRGWWTCG